MRKNANRLGDLFKKWDTNGDGVIDRKEWKVALGSIGVQTSKEVRFAPGSVGDI